MTSGQLGPFTGRYGGELHAAHGRPFRKTRLGRCVVHLRVGQPDRGSPPAAAWRCRERMLQPTASHETAERARRSQPRPEPPLLATDYSLRLSFHHHSLDEKSRPWLAAALGKRACPRQALPPQNCTGGSALSAGPGTVMARWTWDGKSRSQIQRAINAEDARHSLGLLLVVVAVFYASSDCGGPAEHRPRPLRRSRLRRPGCFGDKTLHTPNLDKFAAEGLRLTSCYAAHANCSPSRTALMTGRTPTRVGVRNWIPQDSPVHVRRSEITIATLLKHAGYATCHGGKWHMNGEFNQPTQPQPGDHGFEHWFSTQNNACRTIATPTTSSATASRSANSRATRPTWSWTRRSAGSAHATGEAVLPLRLLPRAARADRLRREIHEALSVRRSQLQRAPRQHHADGRRLRPVDGALDEQHCATNTFVFFTSDNGPAITRSIPTAPPGRCATRKVTVRRRHPRAGHRALAGQNQPGSVSDEPVCGVDFLPTACAIAGIEPPRDRKLDGASFLPVLEGKPVARSTPLYWHFNRASSEPKVAMRVGDWKILATLDKTAGPRQRHHRGGRAIVQRS